jgi:uncharacterized membrane protein YgdD (TMEM256/DUF423 family)
MSRLFLIIGAVNGGLSVACGAFAAHGLSGRLSAASLATFETAARYQMYHALALVAVAVLLTRDASSALERAGWSFLIGIVLFSGSLYALTFTGQTWLGAVTPVGGVAFLAGWALLSFGVLGDRAR